MSLIIQKNFRCFQCNRVCFKIDSVKNLKLSGKTDSGTLFFLSSPEDTVSTILLALYQIL